MNKKIPKTLEPYEDYLKSTIKLSNQIIFTIEDTKPWGSKLGGCPYLEEFPHEGLLLQLDVDDTSGLMFGDSGNCTFIISRRDLLTGNFCKVYYDWQCC